VRLFGADVTSDALETASVEAPDFQIVRVHLLRAAHVHRRHRLPGQRTVGKRRNTAYRTK
jgi:hypothetical protein